MKSSIFALVDCNNFYASCEKLFRPDLRHTPVVVLSNNDGCVVARSKEAKALGIKMGVPIHHIKAEIRRYGIEVFSSNYMQFGESCRGAQTEMQDLTARVYGQSIEQCNPHLTANNRRYRAEQFRW